MAVRFPASGVYTATLTLGSQTNYSFTCWLNLQVDRNTFSVPWSFDANMDGSMLGLNTDSDGTTMKVYDDGVGNFVATGPNMTVGTWYFFAVTVAGTAGALRYRTAAQNTLTSATWTGAARTITRVLLGDDRYSEPFNGRMAAFKFWQAGLTADEVLLESVQTQPVRTANLRLYMPFLGPESLDSSGNGTTFTGGTGTTREDGPPIPWQATAPRLILPAAAAGGTTFPVSVSGAVTPAAAIVKQPQRTTAGATTPTGVATKQTRQPLAGSTTPTGLAPKALSRVVAGSIAPTGSLTSIRSRLLSVAGAANPSGAVVRQAGNRPAGAVAPTGAPVKQTGKRPAGTVTPTGAVATIRTRLLALLGSTTPTGVVAKRDNKPLAGAATPTGAAARSTTRRLVGSVTPSGVAANTRTRLLAVAGLVTPAGVTGKRIGKALAGGVSPVGALLKLLGRLLGGHVAPAGQAIHNQPNAPVTVVTSGQQVRPAWASEEHPASTWRSGRTARGVWRVDR